MSLKAAPVRHEIILLKGGLDLITPTLSLAPGVARDALNMEVNDDGGYTRTAGFERVDGRASPSDAVYVGLAVTGTTTPALGSTITGNTSGATSVLIAQTATAFFVTKVSGIYTATELLKVSGNTVGTYTGSAAASTTKLDAQYTAAAADNYRADIAAMPGSGPARGVCSYNGTVYGFRDNAGGTACVMYSATAAGWAAVSLFKEVSFTAGGATAPADGTTLTQGAVTALIKRVVRASGAWTGTAAGTFVITNVAGGNFAAGAATIGAINVTLSGAETQITLVAGGKYDLMVSNFAGSTSTIRLYGADGKNPAFEFDGTTYVPIHTGNAVDTPSQVEDHKNHLFLVFGASLQHSAPGLPYDYTANTASEIAIGDSVTNLLVQPGSQTTGTLEITTANDTLMLYGTGVSSWNLVTYNTGTGGLAWTAQNMAQSYVLDGRGVMGLQTALAYGNFEQSALTQAVRPFIQEKRTLVTCSALCREKSQYRVFFSDGYALYLTNSNNNYLGCFPIWLPMTDGAGHYGLYQCWEGILSTGDEVIYGCGYDGHVYQFEKGTSFDGAVIPWYLTLTYASIKTPRILKRFRKASIEIQGATYTEVSMSYSLSYGSTLVTAPAAVLYPSNFTQASWDSMSWDHFYWDGQTLIPTECDMIGTGENVAITLSGTGDYSRSFTINSIILHYSLRRGLR